MIKLIKHQNSQVMLLENINTPIYKFKTYIENNSIFMEPVENRFRNYNNTKKCH